MDKFRCSFFKEGAPIKKKKDEDGVHTIGRFSADTFQRGQYGRKIVDEKVSLEVCVACMEVMCHIGFVFHVILLKKLLQSAFICKQLSTFDSLGA